MDEMRQCRRALRRSPLWRWMVDGSLGDDCVGGVVITAYFLLGCLLFAALGWGDARVDASTPAARPWCGADEKSRRERRMTARVCGRSDTTPRRAEPA